MQLALPTRANPFDRLSDYELLHLVTHLSACGRDEGARKLLFDLDWITAKTARCSMDALLLDFDHIPPTSASVQLRDALRLASHTVSAHSEQLASQLLLRLNDEVSLADPLLGGLLVRARAVGGFQLRPRSATLDRSGGPLLKTLAYKRRFDGLVGLDRRRFVTVSDATTVTLWDATTEGAVRAVSTSLPVRQLARLNDRCVLWSEADGSCVRWNVDQRTPERLPMPPVPARQLIVIDQARVALLLATGEVCIYTIDSGQRQLTFNVPSTFVAASLIDRQHLAVVLDDTTLTTWNLSQGRCLSRSPALEHVSKKKTNGCLAAGDGLIAWSFEDHVIAAQALDSQAKPIRVGTHQLRPYVDDRSVLAAPGAIVTVLRALEQGRLVSGSAEGAIKIWQIAESRCLFDAQIHSGPVVDMVALEADRFVSASQDGTLNLWRAAAPSPSQQAAHDAAITSLAELDDFYVVSGSRDCTVKVWDARSAAKVGSLRCDTLITQEDGRCVPEPVNALAVMHSAQVVVSQNDSKISTWAALLERNCDTTYPSKHLDYVWADHSVTSLAMLSGHIVACGLGNGALEIWDLDRHEEHKGVSKPVRIAHLAAHHRAVNVLVRLNDEHVICGAGEHELCIWSHGAKTLLRVNGLGGRVRSLAILGSNHFACGLDSGTLEIWQAIPPLREHSIRAHASSIEGVAVAEQRWIVTGADDGSVKLWDVTNPLSALSELSLDVPISSVLCMSAGGVVVVGDANGRLHFFDLR